MEKAILKKNEAEVLELFMSGKTKEEIIAEYLNIINDNGWKIEFAPLQKIDMQTFIQAVMFGYKVEKPRELIINRESQSVSVLHVNIKSAPICIRVGFNSNIVSHRKTLETFYASVEDAEIIANKLKEMVEYYKNKEEENGKS